MTGSCTWDLLLGAAFLAAVAGANGPTDGLNLGGVGNVTFVGADGALVAFDTGPANGLIDSWVEAETGARYDADGALAASGHVDEAVLTAMLDHPYFAAPSPKSLDRNDFTIQPARGLSAADGAATLTAFTAATVAEALDQLPARPKRLIVAGGVESMSRAPYVIGKGAIPFDRGAQLFDSTIGWRFVNRLMKEQYGIESMGETAENVASQYQIPRAAYRCKRIG